MNGQHMNTLPDITTRKDVETLVDLFYSRIQKDALLAPQFSHVNWSTHLPIMYRFWSSMLLGEQSYRGNPLQKHVALPIGADHFSQWLILFRESVDALFLGEKAEEIKTRAANIANVFQHKLNIVKSAD